MGNITAKSSFATQNSYSNNIDEELLIMENPTGQDSNQLNLKWDNIANFDAKVP